MSSASTSADLSQFLEGNNDGHSGIEKIQYDVMDGEVSGHQKGNLSQHFLPTAPAASTAPYDYDDDVYGSLSAGCTEEAAEAAEADGGRGIVVQTEIPTRVAPVTLLAKRSAQEAGICEEMTAVTGKPQPESVLTVLTATCYIPGCGRSCRQIQPGGTPHTPPISDNNHPVAVLCSVHKRDPNARAAKLCPIEGCQRVRSIGQYCTRHGKDPTAPIQNTPRGQPCKIHGCVRVVKRHGVCYRHYNLKDSDVETLHAMEQSVARPMQAYVDNPHLWDTLFHQLEAFGMKNGHFQIPLGRADLFELSQFVGTIREAYATLNSRNGIASNGVTYDVPKYDDSIEGLVAVHPGIDAATTSPSGSNDSTTTTERAMSVLPPIPNRSQASAVLTPERITRLNSIGFPLQWSNHHTGGNFHLMQPSLPDEHGNHIHQHNGIVEPCSGVSVPSWEARYDDLLNFHRQHGHYKVSPHNDFALWSWCKSQRQKYKQTMDGIRLENAERLGQQQDDRSGKGRPGQSSIGGEISPGGEGGADNVGGGRSATPPKTNIWKMSAERIVRLQAINFEWDAQASEYDASWNKRYIDLLKYKAVHGDCKVPKTHQNRELAQWVKQMRRYYALRGGDRKGAPSTFTDERIRQLEEIGFEWRMR